jgi:hypothetical protein
MGPGLTHLRAQTHAQDLHRAADRAYLAKLDLTQQELRRMRSSRNAARARAFVSPLGRLFSQIRASRLRPDVVGVIQSVKDDEIIAAVRRHHNMDVSYVYAHLKVDAGGPSKAATSRRLHELVDEGVLRMREDAGGTRYAAATPRGCTASVTPSSGSASIAIATQTPSELRPRRL